MVARIANNREAVQQRVFRGRVAFIGQRNLPQAQARGSGFAGNRRTQSGVLTIGATVMLSSPGANPPAFGLPNEIVLTPAWSRTGMTMGCGSLKVLPLRSSSIGVPLLTVAKKVRGPCVA